MAFLGTLFFFILGAISASFVSVVSERAYTGQSWARGRSRCNSCRVSLVGRDLVPLASWLIARGRCRHCGSRLPATYLVAEALMGTLFAASYAVLDLGVPLLFFLASLLVLAFIVLYDLRHLLVPPVSSLLLTVFALGYTLVTIEGLPAFGLTLLVAGTTALFLFLLYAGTRGRGMGLGDAPVGFALALLTGSTNAITGLLFSFWIGALFGILILLRRRGGPTMGIEVPFVPFLAAGFLLAYFTTWNPFPFFGL